MLICALLKDIWGLIIVLRLGILRAKKSLLTEKEYRAIMVQKQIKREVREKMKKYKSYLDN